MKFDNKNVIMIDKEIYKMYEVIFYKDRNGNSEVLDLLDSLTMESIKSKNARINRNKILAYISVLSERGAKIGEPFVKHLEGELWELRPIRNRIFFFVWTNDRIVLLHYFIKKTSKTPRKEIEKAKREMEDFLERFD